MKRINGYSNRQVRMLDAMRLYCGKLRTVEEIMDISGLADREKTLMHLLDLYHRGFVTRYTAEVYTSDDAKVYYLINDAGKAAFDVLLAHYGEDVLDECMTEAEMEDRALAED